MPAWYDIPSLEHRDPDSLMGFAESRAYIVELVEAIAKQHSGSIIVGGFSQGGAVALSAGLSAPLLTPRPAGVFALSTYAVTDATPDASDIPLFWAHGEADDMVKFQWGQTSFDKLKTKGQLKDTTFESYKRMGHEICMEELDALAKFFDRV